LTTNKHHGVGGLLLRPPWFAGFCTHQHVYTLEDHALAHAFHVKDPFVTIQVGTKYLHYAAQELFQTFRYERFFRFENEGADFIVMVSVMMIVMMVIVM